MNQIVKKDPLAEVKRELMSNSAKYKTALPPTITPEKFFSVVSTALSQNLDLLSPQMDRQSLFTSALKCAADGLLPDGREAAFVKFGNKIQYMPMVQGIIKKVRNSGELASINAQVVYQNDTFKYRITQDGEEFEHVPLFSGDRGKIIMTYAIARTKDGAFYIEVLTEEQVMAVKNVSKAASSGPWSGPFADEMRRKTAIRRLSKRLPMSTDVSQVIERDDEMVELTKDPERKSGASQDFSFEAFGTPIEIETEAVQPQAKDEGPAEWEQEAAKIDPRVVK